jgi:nicotinamidase-related amidase
MDFQAGICTASGAAGRSGIAAEVDRRGVLPRIRTVLERARARSLYIVHVRVAFDDRYTLRTNRSKRFDGLEQQGGLLLGSDEAQFCPEAQPLQGEPVITKGGVDPFIGTPLMEILVARRIRDLAVCGVATNFVVESAVRHAADSGFAVTVLEDCCASYDEAMHDFAVKKTLPAFAEIRQAAVWLMSL